jgi:hypothetical protein
MRKSGEQGRFSQKLYKISVVSRVVAIVGGYKE